jgi:hypothetical protein
MNHDNLTPTSSSPLGATGPVGAAASAPSFDLAQQRRALQGQVDTLRQAGALPSASAAGQPGSAVQWNNWSNG